jgi:hypothetical protein
MSNMTRRVFIMLLGGAAVWPLVARTWQSYELPRHDSGESTGARASLSHQEA